MNTANWNKEKINLPLRYDERVGVTFSPESDQVCVADVRRELEKLGVTEDVYGLLDAAPCEERYGMIRPGFDSRIKLVITEPAWGAVFGWNQTSDLWSVVRLLPGDGTHTLIRMKDGGLGTIRSFHSSEEQATEAMKRLHDQMLKGASK